MARDDVTTLTITVTKTSDGLRDYVQIMSGDMFTTNVVLIADRITVDDHRTKTTVVRVWLPAELSYTGRARWADKPIDSCIAPIVNALNRGGVLTRTSCCGHGRALSLIDLHDGRMLTIEPFKTEETTCR